MNDIGLVSWRLPGDLLNALTLCNKLSTDVLEIDFGGPGRGLELDSLDLFKIREYAEVSNVTVSSLAINTYNDIGIKSSSYECKTLFFRALDVAEQLGIHSLFIPSFRKSLIENEIDIINTAGFLQWCCDAAGPQFVIASENTLIVDDSKLLLSLVNRKNFSLLFDPANLFLMGIDPYVYFVELFPALYNDIHIKSPTGVSFSELDNDFLYYIHKLFRTPHILRKRFYYFSENDYRQAGNVAIQNDISWLKEHLQLIKV
ncbi:hypothetical protein CWC46_03970 [Prodigiosinella confusarubida]|uniref:Xylose isomerase-like TIM barrel domain-containing protein n=1 Tax=Serratia sp. (strain ATCC 39006) TaxID=104623 RepID=A0A2I5T396_SERS3|nr:hypothetical protein [Serratia sp. ATCC 39006]AUG99047.1 hypothetical protein CWC46_03970 [Serratia sp. ATCC 39006]AUH03362.1 hypothetical protein Ser39006_003970 [Serratia sp. ATCC 39006]